MEPLGADLSLGSILALSTSIAVILVLIGLVVGIYGYYTRRMRAATEDARDLADLVARLDQTKAEIEQAQVWRQEAQEELLKLEGERTAQETLRNELYQQETALADAQQKADDARQEVLDLQYATTALATDKENLETAIATDTEAAEAARQQKETAVEAATAAQGNTAELLADVEAKRTELTELTNQIAQDQSRRNQLEADIGNLEVKQQSIQTELQRLGTELAEIQSSLVRAQAEAEPIREQVRERLRLEAEVKELQSMVGELEKKEEILQEAQGLKLSAAKYSDLFQIEPPCLAERVYPRGVLENVEEQDALDHVKEHVEAQGLLFSDRVISAFHTCLKVNSISPITVLAGISGTGKSELPLRYAEAMGMHSLNIAVQPSWSSPQDLFGFYNYLEERYKATELARALVRMDPFNFAVDDPAFADVRENSRSERMLLVLIDEMNLARVEYYFSEFLSKLEARRAVLDPAQPKNRAPAEIEVEGAQRSILEGQAPTGIRLWVGSNVLFVGTMNEDESTQTLSDKVLDRANVLRFGKPPSSEISRSGRDDQYARNNYLKNETWDGWIQSSSIQGHWQQEVDAWIERLNEALGLIGRPFGWRVKEAIHDYVANYPGVRAGNVYKTAIADQVEQKILPKLRGVDTTQQLATQALNQVEAILDELGDDELSQAVVDCHHDAQFGTFNWTGVTRE